MKINQLSEYIRKLKFVTFYGTILGIICLLTTQFVTPHLFLNEFSTGPMLWLVAVISFLLFMLSLRISLCDGLNRNNFSFADLILLLITTYILFSRYEFGEVVFSIKTVIFLCLVLEYFIIKTFFLQLNGRETKIFAEVILITVFIIILINCAHGLLQYIGRLPSHSSYFIVTGNFPNPARFANTIVAFSPAIIGCLFLTVPNLYIRLSLKILAIILLLFVFFILYTTYTRGTWLPFLGAFLFLALQRSLIISKLRDIRFLIAAIIITLIVGCLLFQLKPESSLGRLTIWKITTKMILEKPITGIGYGEFENRYNLYQAKYFLNGHASADEIRRADIVRYPYNIFLQILSEQGLIGFLLFLFFIIPVFVKALFTTNESNYEGFIRKISLAGIITIVGCGFTSYPFDILPVIILFALYMAIASGAANRNISAHSSNRKSFVVGLCLIINSLMLIRYAKTEYTSNRQLRDVMESDSSPQSLETFYEEFKDNPDFLKAYSEEMLSRKKYNLLIATVNKPSLPLIFPETLTSLARAFSAIHKPDSAEKYYKIASNIIPNRFSLRYDLLYFYYSNRMYGKAYILSRNILAMPVKIESYDVTDIQNKTKKIMLDSYKHLQFNER